MTGRPDEQMTESFADKNVQVMGHVVDSLTVRDLMSVTLSPSSTYIIKTDIEDLDCEVL